jgi:hypothetical protein
MTMKKPLTFQERSLVFEAVLIHLKNQRKISYLTLRQRSEGVTEAFYKLKQQKEYKGFLSELYFDTNGERPTSEQIREMLSSFQVSQELFFDGTKYYILPEGKMEEVVSRLQGILSEEELQEIVEIFVGLLLGEIHLAH